jgi:hypothetical protein
MESNSTSEKKSKNKNNHALKEEFTFTYQLSEDLEVDDEYEKTLERDIETNCDLSVYVNKLELEEKSDSELLLLSKEEIVDFKNYQIQKLKAYIFSLEKEKEDLIENFKNTTNVLIDKIKEQEFRDCGVRPETPFIAKKLKTAASHQERNSYKDNTYPANSYSMNKNFFGDDEESKFTGEINLKTGLQRCPHCTKEFAQEYFLQHSLDCLRNKIRCKKCSELIDEKFKKEHLLEWRSKEVSN